MIHITERDRQLTEHDAIHNAIKAEFEEALSAGDVAPELFARLVDSARERRRLEAKPVKFVCAGSDCAEEHELVGCAIYTVVAVSRHLREADRWITQEFDRDHLRHIVLCEDCDAKSGFPEYLHERSLDGAQLPHKQAEAELRRLRVYVDELEDKVLELSRVQMPVQEVSE